MRRLLGYALTAGVCWLLSRGDAHEVECEAECDVTMDLVQARAAVESARLAAVAAAEAERLHYDLFDLWADTVGGAA